MMKSSTLDAHSSESRPASPPFVPLPNLGPDRSLPEIGPETTRLPLLVAFKSQLVEDADKDTDEADVERIRAEVRGLGVTLLIVAPDGVRFFESNDRYRCLKSPDQVVPRQLMTLFRTFAVIPPPPSAAGGLTAAFVIGPQFEIRFAFRPPAEGSPDIGSRRDGGVLLRALVVASTSFEMIRLPHVPLAELTTRALVMGFEQAISGTEAHAPGGSASREEQLREDQIRHDGTSSFGVPSRLGSAPTSGVRRKTDPAILRRRSPHVTGPRLDADR